MAKIIIRDFRPDDPIFHEGIGRMRLIRRSPRTWGVWCEVSGGITGSRQGWLTTTQPGPKNPAVVARFTEVEARAEADRRNREMRHNTHARSVYAAKELC